VEPFTTVALSCREAAESVQPHVMDRREMSKVHLKDHIYHYSSVKLRDGVRRTTGL